MASTAQRGDTVTLQFGRFSNYVGAHFWNLQDELIGALSQDVDDARGVDVSGLYRASSSSSSHSQSAAGVTYTPRALIYDLRSSLGSLLSADYSQGDATTAAPKPDPRVLQQTWSGGVVEHAAPPSRKHAFQSFLEQESSDSPADPAQGGGGPSGGTAAPQEEEFHFDETVKSWSDYLKCYLHPRSVQTLAAETNFVPGPTAFKLFSEGVEVWTAHDDERERAEDNLRRFLEECDRPSHVQCFVDVDSGWAGYAQHFLELVRDSCRASISVYGCYSPDRAKARKLNEALALASLTQRCDQFVPLQGLADPAVTVPSLHGPTPLNMYQQAGLYATAIDTITLPSRLTSENGLSMGTMIGCCVAAPDQNIGSLTLTLPFDELNACSSEEALNDLVDRARGFTSAESFHPREIQLSVPGPFLNKFALPVRSATTDPRNQNFRIPVAQVMVVRGAMGKAKDLAATLPAAQQKFGLPRSLSVVSPNGLITPVTFPRFKHFPRAVDAVSAAARLQTNPLLHPYLADTARSFGSLTSKLMYKQCEKHGMDQEQYAGMLDRLNFIADAYESAGVLAEDPYAEGSDED